MHKLRKAQSIPESGAHYVCFKASSIFLSLVVDVIKRKEKKDGKLSGISRVAKAGITFGVGMAIRLVLGFYGGRWIDHQIGTDPWFMLFGVLLAIGLSFYYLITEFMKMDGGNSNDKVP